MVLTAKERDIANKAGNGGRDLKKRQPLLGEAALDKLAGEIFGPARKGIAFDKLRGRSRKTVKVDPKGLQALNKDVAIRLSTARKDGTEHKVLREFYRNMMDPDAHATASREALKKAGIMPK